MRNASGRRESKTRRIRDALLEEKRGSLGYGAGETAHLDSGGAPAPGRRRDVYKRQPKGIGIELNTNRGNTPLPDEKWLRLYRSLGGEIVTLGTDAHTPGFVGCAVREGQALLRACGFRRFAAFRQGKPVWHEL